MIVYLPNRDSEVLAEWNRAALDIDREDARARGRAAVKAIEAGGYEHPRVGWVDLSEMLDHARQEVVSIPPDARLPRAKKRKYTPEDENHPVFSRPKEKLTYVDVANETTLQAAQRLMGEGYERPLVLNFANGVQPCGGFLTGSRAQEETLCRTSGLFATLEHQPMYEAHQQNEHYESSDWAIYSPDVPVFATDSGELLEEPWRLSVLTCAAPVAHRVGLERSRKLLEKRIHRVLKLGELHGHDALVLGAWGCGAFGNDPATTAQAFKSALEGRFNQAFSRVTFAITSWGPDRPAYRPFADVFNGYPWSGGVVDPVARLERLRDYVMGYDEDEVSEPLENAMFEAISELAEQDGWIWPEFDHVGWHIGAEGFPIRLKDENLWAANESQLAKLITTLVRLHGPEHLAVNGSGGIGINESDRIRILRGLAVAARNRLEELRAHHEPALVTHA